MACNGKDDQCSESDWILKLYGDPCMCEQHCLLTINSVSKKYSNGIFFSKVFTGSYETLATYNVTVIPNHKSNPIYYIIGGLVGVIVIIFIVIGVTCNIKERCYSKKRPTVIRQPVEQTFTRKEILRTIV